MTYVLMRRNRDKSLNNIFLQYILMDFNVELIKGRPMI